MKKPPPITDFAGLPVMLTLADMAALYRVSEATIRRGLQEHTWRPLPFDKYPYRWLKSDVEKQLKSQRTNLRFRRHGFAARAATS